MLTMEPGRTGTVAADELAALESIQRRVLWLATNMIHHANHVRPNLDGSKIGGHQASSSSVDLDPDRALLPRARSRRPRRRQAARLAGLPRRPVPARQPAQEVPDRAALPQGHPGVPQQVEGPRPDRLLDRLGRARRGRAGLLGRRRPLRRAPLRRHHLQAVHRPARRRRAGRGQRLGGRLRGPRPGARQRPLDRRPQPPEPRPRHPRHPRRPVEVAVPGERLAGAGVQVRPPAQGRLRAARTARRSASASTR